ncbi:hypothetical protein [Sphingomonas sp.]|uniref:hypothetical protein n=1 Tax=Sphingomonas sp. TaxID=28214 RepID=UPI003D6D38B6
MIFTVGLSFISLMISGLHFILKNQSAAIKPRISWSLYQYLDVFLPIGFGAIVLRELRIIMYAFRPGRDNAQQLKMATSVFSNHFVARPVLISLFCLALVELVIGNLLVRLLPPWVAVLHAGIGLFFLIYVMGLIRSFTSLPTMIVGGALHMRMTVLFDAVTPVGNVRAVSLIHSMPVAPNIANGAIIVAPNVLVEFHYPISVNRMFKPQSFAEAIAIYVDKPATFMATLKPLVSSEVESPLSI